MIAFEIALSTLLEAALKVLDFGKSVYFICHDSIGMNKEFNITRHYKTKHVEFKELSGQTRKDANTRNLCSNIFHFCIKKSDHKRKYPVGYIVLKLIAEIIKFFVERACVIECLMAVVDFVCPEKSRYFHLLAFLEEELQDESRICQQNVRVSLKNTTVKFEYFSVALDESTDLKDTEQKVIFVRAVMPNLDIAEVFVHFILMKGTTTWEDIFKALRTAMADVKLSFSKLAGVTTDGVRVMIGQKKKASERQKKAGVGHQLH